MTNYGDLEKNTNVYGDELLWEYSRSELDLVNDTDKAYINTSDLNRIEKRTKELSDILGLGLVTKTDWVEYTYATVIYNNIDSIPTKAQTDRIINNINVIYSNVDSSLLTVEPPKTMRNMTIFMMNDIELLLKEMYYAITT